MTQDALPGLAPTAGPTGGVYPTGVDVARHAQISTDGNYRYRLLRRWGDGPATTFVMLNPSDADGRVDDPTVRRCVGFARSLGCAALIVVNLYAFRATMPAVLWKVADPVGPENDAYLEQAAGEAARRDAPLIVAWGTNAKPERVDQVMQLRGMARAHALAVSVAGIPKHPLYLRADSVPTPWSPR